MLQILQTCKYEHIEKFVVYGERHCGTNFLVNSLKCFNLQQTEFFGHKHWLGFAKPEKIQHEMHTVFACIARNPYDWISAFYELPHHIPKKKYINIFEFITSEWYSVGFDHQEILQDRNFSYNPPIRYKNIFEMRSTKNNYIINILPFLARNYIFLTYEDLISNYYNIMNIIKNRFKLKQEKNFPEPFKAKQRYLDNDIKTIIDNKIIWTIENQIGYQKL